MTNLQAALGISQMSKLEYFFERRQEIASMYNEAFKTMDSVVLPMQLEGTQSGWHLYMLQLKLDKLKRSCRGVFESLRAENIGVHVHYIPVYWHPYYQKLGYKKGICQKAEALARLCLFFMLINRVLTFIQLFHS
jgi:dTDP-4-amino-4,6-dideoxygalactose transaminase